MSRVRVSSPAPQEFFELKTRPSSSGVERILGKDEVSGSNPDLGSRFIDMLVHVVNAKYVDGYRIEVTFNNGRRGIADFAESLDGSIFEPLKDETEFSRFKVDKELDTLVWANGADMAPEFIYYQAFKSDPSLRDQFRDWGYLS